MPRRGAIRQLRVRAGITVGELVAEFRRAGALGAGMVAKAVDVLVRMLGDPSYTTMLGLAGPLVPGGLRQVVADLVGDGLVDAIVMSGSNVVHDALEALGHRHYRSVHVAGDGSLRRLRIGRIADIYVPHEAFEALEAFTRRTLGGVAASSIAASEFLRRMGMGLRDPNSILVQAATKGVPVFCPGVVDSMLAFHLLGSKGPTLDVASDFGKLVDLATGAERVGAVLLGGGLPKHHILAASMLRGGVDAAVQVTLDRPEGGSLSGAPLEEAISWRKAKARSNLVTVIGDATIIFPLLVAATLDRLALGARIGPR